MNKVYKVIWNASVGAWVAVSELATAKGKSSKSNMVGAVLLAVGGVTFSADALAAVTETHYYAVNETNTSQGNKNNDGAQAEGSMAAGVNANVGVAAKNGTALGINSSVQVEDGVALGSGANVTVGNKPDALGGIAIGYQATSINDGIAMGRNARANSGDDTGGIAIGHDSVAYAHSVALGTGANADQAHTDIDNASVAIGAQANSGDSDGGVAIGVNSRIGNRTGDTVAIGRKANVGDGAEKSLALGSNTTINANAKESTALGYASKVTRSNGTAIGNGSEVNKEYAVAIGSGAKTDKDATSETTATVGGITYGNFAGQAAKEGMQVSLGAVGAERQLKNLAAGNISANSTDGINGSQLHATNTVLGNVASSTATILGGDVKVGTDGKLTGPFNVNGKGYDSVAKAIEDNAGAKVNIAGDKNIKVDNNNGDYTVGLVENVDLGKDGSITAGDTKLDNTGLSIANGGPSITKDGINAGNKKVTGVADGVIAAGSKDAVNGGQLDQATKDLTNKGLDFAANSGEFHRNLGDKVTIKGALASGEAASAENIRTVANDKGELEIQLAKNLKGLESTQIGNTTINTDGLTIAGGPSITKDGIKAGNKKVTDVADGVIAAGSKDAVNGGQIDNISNSIKNSIGGNTTVNPDGSLTTSNVGNTGKDNIHDAIKSVNETANKGWNLTANGKDSSNVKPGDVVDFASNDSNIKVSKEGNNVKVDLSKDLTGLNSVQVGDTTINTDGLTIAGGPSITKDGIKAGNKKVTDVADGVIAAGSKDAVNGGQIDNISNSIKNSIGGNTTVNPDGSLTTSNVGNTGKDNIHDAIDSVNKAAAAAKTDVKAGDNITVDSKVNADGSKEFTVATKKDVKFDSVTLGDTVLNKDGLKVGKTGPSITVDGINAAGKKVTNVADGVIAAGSKDAVNGGQIDNISNSIKNSIGGNTTVNPDGSLTTSNVGNTGKDNIHDAIDSVNKAAAAAKTDVKAGDNITVDSKVNADGSKEFTVATKKDVKFDSVTLGDTVLNKDGLKVGKTGPSITVDGINAAGKKVTNVADGVIAAGSKDAVNGGQIDNISNSIKNSIGGNTTVNPDGSLTTSNVGNTGKDNIHDAIDSVNKAAAAAKTDVKAGDNITVDSKVNADGSKEFTVATKKDVKFDSVTLGNTLLNQNGLTIQNGGPSITMGGIFAGNQKVTGVADGTIAKGSKDAVNGGQIDNISNSIKNSIGGETKVNADGSLTTSNVGNTGKDNIHDAISSINDKAQATDDFAVKYDKNADGSVNKDSVTLGGKPLTSEKDSNGRIKTEGGTALDNVKSVGDYTDTANAGKAVNGGDLNNAVKDAVKQSGDNVSKILGGDTTVNADGSVTNKNIGGTGKDNINDAISSVGQAAKEAKTSVSAGDNITVKESKNADGSTNYEVATKKDVKFDSVTSGEINTDKITVGGKGGVTIDNSGINAGNKKVTGVEDGTIAAGSKDAVNGGQLNQSYQDMSSSLGGGAKYENGNWTGPTYNVNGGSYNNVGDALGALNDRDNQLNNKIDNLFQTTNQRIDNVEKRANAGIAAAMALESAPYVAGKWTYSAAAAHHGGENAVGVTLRKTADNGRWSLTGGIAAASEGDPSFRIGISGVID